MKQIIYEITAKIGEILEKEYPFKKLEIKFIRSGNNDTIRFINPTPSGEERGKK